jgi:hypothetical protein
MQFLILARVAEGVAIEQVLPHVGSATDVMMHCNDG